MSVERSLMIAVNELKDASREFKIQLAPSAGEEMISMVQNGSFEDVVGAPPRTDPSIMEGPTALAFAGAGKSDSCSTA